MTIAELSARRTVLAAGTKAKRFLIIDDCGFWNIGDLRMSLDADLGNEGCLPDTEGEDARNSQIGCAGNRNIRCETNGI